MSLETIYKKYGPKAKSLAQSHADEEVEKFAKSILENKDWDFPSLVEDVINQCLKERKEKT